MISTLLVQNIALIQNAEINFGKGLNIISGETGSGKSILIDSLNFVLGDRADKSLIRHNSETALVEVTFVDVKNKEIENLCNLYGIDFDDEIIINRTMTINGKNECRINGRLITVSQVRKIVSLLVDVHLQHQNQYLLNEQNHIYIFDEYIGNSILKIKNHYRSLLTTYNNILKDIASYGNENERIFEINMLSHQLKEIESTKIEKGEEENLIKQRNILQNQEHLILLLEEAANLLDYGNEFSCLSSLNNILKSLKGTEKYTDNYIPLVDRIESCSIELSDILSEIKNTLSDFNLLDISSLDSINKRLDQIRSVKRKYGSDIESIQSFYNQAKNRLEKLLNAENHLNKQKDEKDKIYKQLLKLADEMHLLRQKHSKSFANEIISHLRDLDMQNVQFEVNIIKNENISFEDFNNNGYDNVVFNISPNLGEPLKNLSKIASGGEMSRLMVGLKNITADFEHIDTLVFDEIDTGISGYVAKTVAKKLYNIALNHQVISVTHLPQIVAMADVHFLISKHTKNNSTFTQVTKLNEEESLKEIMRLAGSDTKSVAGLNNAKELKTWANNYKTLKNS
ncbi:MAG TPA: DNA repair protein RecN [Clostridiales bacterium]|nr:DNA repair protein RecN [Clostridiales bacterium]